MKKVFLLASLVTVFSLSAVAGDLDSLKQQLQYNLNDTAKASLYLQMAQAYLDQKAPNRVYKTRNSENAVNYTMLALHLYSKLEDTTGLKNSYASLGKAYHAGRKYTQAKWFMIQSTVLAKGQKDVDGMVSSLIELANIKMETGEYKTAKKDLDYAMKLSSKYSLPQYQSDIAQSMALADNGIKQLPEDEAIATTTEAVNGTSTISTDSPVIKTVKAKTTAKGRIYKGKISKANTVAVKKSKLVKDESLAAL